MTAGGRSARANGQEPGAGFAGGRRFLRSRPVASASSAGFAALRAIRPGDEAALEDAIAAAKTGDREALRYLYVRFSGNVYAYVREMLRDDHEAEDVAQHVFERLPLAIRRYRPTGVPFTAWLLRVARNAALDHMRRHRLVPVEEVFGPDATTSDAIETLDGLRSALAELPAAQREVVVLRNLVGLSPGEIADRMGKTESSIHGLHHRGRAAVQGKLASAGQAPGHAGSREADAAATPRASEHA